MQYLRLLSSLPLSMHANIITGSENFPFYFFHIFTHLFNGTDLPITPAPFSAPPCPLPTSRPCFLAEYTTCGTLSSDHVLPLIMSFLGHKHSVQGWEGKGKGKLGRKGKLKRKWLTTPHFENMHMYVSAGECVSTCQMCQPVSAEASHDAPTSFHLPSSSRALGRGK